MIRAPAEADRSLEWQQWAHQTIRRLLGIRALVSLVFLATETTARAGVLPALQPLSLTLVSMVVQRWRLSHAGPDQLAPAPGITLRSRGPLTMRAGEW